MLTFLWSGDCHAATAAVPSSVPLVTALGTQLLDTDGPFRTAVSDFVSIFGLHRTPQMTARVLHQFHSTDLAFYNFNSSKQDPNQHVTMSPACLPHHHMSNNITPRGEITFFLDKFMIL